MSVESLGDYHPTDLYRLSAARNIDLDLSASRPVGANGPVLSGRILSAPVQRGLDCVAYDVAYLSDMKMRQRCGRTLLLAIQVSGEAEPMRVEGAEAAMFRPGLVVAVATGEGAECLGSCRAGQRCATVAAAVSPEFFDRFDEDDGDDGLDPLQAMVEGGARVRELGASWRLSHLAAETLADRYDGRLARLHLESATLAFVTEAARLAGRSTAEPHALSARQYERMVEVKRAIDADAFAVPTMAALARRAGVSASTLRSHYRKAFGIAPFDYVRTRRLELAQGLLRNRELSVAEVAYRVGFTDQAAFATAYRRRFGYPPSREANRA
ncbi:hypothetical protein GCM10008171_27040 [Methylopila jiangsuensis]|uniref:HTH araC/xylS-type domain-containing protein n=1 Tax=Methylopila jiangsuensis TaxID=586230 RepID=A0A9W6JKC2_9HYPH|nr:helix-turn-helix transcriptional regulator [Methylopila jiangsuensis]MDR6285162.1 AraC-like DNA-binding protein [Methylopila jiangsuensis]GLK77450.1 hypothetical protein GCM10008171_27040 [Methylopila jiangsuensis]